MIDPHLRNCYSEKEVQSMLRCASLCIRRDPDLRPRMCQVWKLKLIYVSTFKQKINLVVTISLFSRSFTNEENMFGDSFVTLCGCGKERTIYSLELGLPRLSRTLDPKSVTMDIKVLRRQSWISVWLKYMSIYFTPLTLLP